MTTTAGELTPVEMSILELERIRWKYAGAKVGFILNWFGLSEVHYLMALHALLGRPEAEAYDPVTVRRLRRQRDARLAARRRGFPASGSPESTVGGP